MRWNNILQYFIPHPQTHQKARLISWHYLIIYLLLFMLLRVSFDLVSIFRPGVLGISANINVAEIIDKVNQERAQKGLSKLSENQTLAQAADAKAKNMFDENYWAHFSPSGKDPWKFILSAGYKFSYAGENLAKNFYNSDDVVKAWMASPSHKENILNPNYQDIGIAVEEGTLQGQKTVLIVQMFGRPYQAVAAASPSLPVPPAKVDLGGQKIEVKAENAPSSYNPPVLVAGSSIQNQIANQTAALDPFLTMKVAGIIIFSFVAFLTLLDFIILQRRGVFRFSSHHFAHLSFIAISMAALLFSKSGSIL